MDDFKTIITFTYPSEVYIIKGRLESEGIDCFVKDELTIQANPFYSNAVGGIKLQVKETDIKRALDILKEAGYKIETSLTRPKYWEKLDRITSTVPFFNRLIIELRVVTILTLIIVLVIPCVYYMTLPAKLNLRQNLTQEIWCINSVFFNSDPIQVKTTPTISLVDHCTETLQLKENGDIILPGVNTRSISGKWTLKDSIISIYDLDTLDNIFGGEFKVDLYGGGLTLESRTTTIYVHM